MNRYVYLPVRYMPLVACQLSVRTRSSASTSLRPFSIMAGDAPVCSEQGDKALINLLRGWPSPSVLPVAQLRAAAEYALSDPSVYIPALQYGPDPGYRPLREALARWLGDIYSSEQSTADNICITGGASQNLACILQSFTDPAYTRAVWAVAPCYYLACPIFADAGLASPDRLRPVPEDEQGIDLGYLEAALRDCDAHSGPDKVPYKFPAPQRKLYRHVIYVVPTCANPSGKTMTVSHREGLVRLARAHDALIISDDVYDFLQWHIWVYKPGGRVPLVKPLPRFSDIDATLGPSAHDPPGRRFGHAVSNGSFSKLIGPGVRTGWAHASVDFVAGLAHTGSTRSGGAPSQLAAAMVHQLLANGSLDTHLEDVTRPTLRTRYLSILDAVDTHLAPLGVTVRRQGEMGSGVYGGYFVWLTLPEGAPPAGEIGRRAKEEENLIVAPGELFEVGIAGTIKGTGMFERNIRLCFSWEEEHRIVEGVQRLARVMSRLSSGLGGHSSGTGSLPTGEFK